LGYKEVRRDSTTKKEKDYEGKYKKGGHRTPHDASRGKRPGYIQVIPRNTKISFQKRMSRRRREKKIQESRSTKKNAGSRTKKPLSKDAGEKRNKKKVPRVKKKGKRHATVPSGGKSGSRPAGK